MKLESEIMRGAGPAAVLQLLSQGEMYGYQIAETLEQRSQGIFTLGQSTLYPMLYNLEGKGLVASTNKIGSNGRRRRYYRLTPTGKKRLKRDRDQWAALIKGLTALGIAQQDHGEGNELATGGA